MTRKSPKRCEVKCGRLNWKGRLRLARWMFSKVTFVVDGSNKGILVGLTKDKEDNALAFKIADALNAARRKASKGGR